jgi:hypothetical protein
MATDASTDALREQAGATLRQATRSASAKLDAQKDSAASGLDNFAQALRKAGGETDGAGRFADMAADRLEQLSNSLRNKDLDSLVEDAESFARRQPVAFFGAAVFAGFLAVRFLKSSRRAAGDASPATGMPVRV